MTEGRVLLVESEAEVRDVLSRVLERRGYAVTLAETSADGVAALVRDSYAYEVALLRMTMADGRAAEVVELVNRAPSPSPTLLLSGSQPTADAFKTRVDCSTARFLVKPFSARDLVSAVRGAVDAHRARYAAPEPVFDASFDGLLDDDPPTPAPPARLGGLSDAPGPMVDASVAPPIRPPSFSPTVASVDLADVQSPPPMPTPAPPEGALRTPAFGDTDEPHGLLAPEPDAAVGGTAWSEPAAPVAGPPAEPAAYEPAEARLGPRTDTQVLLRDAELFPSVPQQPSADPTPGPEAWNTREAAAEAAQLQPSALDEDERQFFFSPMSGDGTDEPRGTYGALSLPELLFNTYRDMFTGRLVLERGAVKKVVLLAGGRPVGALSNIRSETLGYILLEAGQIDEVQQRESLALAQREGIRQGEALVRLGALSAEALSNHLRQQTEERLLNCFTWVGGRYGMIYDPSVDGAHDGYEINPLQLVFAGTFSAFPVGPMLQHFDRMARKRLRRTERFHDYKGLLRRFETQLVVAELCDGARTFGEVVAASPLGLVDTVRTLRALELLRCVGFVDEAPAELARVTPEAAEAGGEGEPRRARHSTRPGGEQRALYRHNTDNLRRRNSSVPDDSQARPRRTTSDGARRRTPTGDGAGRARRATGSVDRRSRPGLHRSGRTTRGASDRTPAPSTSRRSTRPNTPVSTPARHITGSGSRSNTGSLRPVSGIRSTKPTPTPGERISPSQLKKRLLARHAAMAGQTHYEVLEIEVGAGTDEIRAAYQRISRLMHQAAAHDHRLAEKAQAVGRRLAEAASVLTDARRKAEYDAITLRSDAAHEGEMDPARAQAAFDRGKACLARKDFAKAFEHFETANRHSSGEPLFRMFRAFARFKLSYPRHRQAALDAHEDLKRALLEDSTADDGFVLMAHLYKDTGNVEMAVKFYRKALTLNRRNRAAADALTLIGSQAETDESEGKESGRLFGKLFKR